MKEIEIHPFLHVGFGVLSDFVVEQDHADGVTYPASRAAVAATIRRESPPVMLVEIEGKLIAVTQEEAVKNGLEEREGEWYQHRVTAHDLAAVSASLRAHL